MGLFDDHVVIACANCNGDIIMTRTKQEQLRRSGSTFYCPGGHAQSYTGTEERLRKELAQMTTYRDNVVVDRDEWKRRYYEERKSGQRMARRIAALQGVITRMKNKASKNNDHVGG